MQIQEILKSLESTLQEHKDSLYRNQLRGMDPDSAFDLGYEAAVTDLKRLAERF